MHVDQCLAALVAQQLASEEGSACSRRAVETSFAVEMPACHIASIDKPLFLASTIARSMGSWDTRPKSIV